MGMLQFLKDGCSLTGKRTYEENSRAENNMNKNIDAGMSLAQRKKKQLGD